MGEPSKNKEKIKEKGAEAENVGKRKWAEMLLSKQQWALPTIDRCVSLAPRKESRYAEIKG